MNFVPVKSVDQQDIQAVHRIRELLIQLRTALINQSRGLLTERGIAIARSVLIRVAGKQDARSVWLQELIARSGYNRATVALANKNARIIQSVLSGESSYRPSAMAG